MRFLKLCDGIQAVFACRVQVTMVKRFNQLAIWVVALCLAAALQ